MLTEQQAGHRAIAGPSPPSLSTAPPVPLRSSEVTTHLTKCHSLRQTRRDDSCTSVRTGAGTRTGPRAMARLQVWMKIRKSRCGPCLEMKTLRQGTLRRRRHTGAWDTWHNPHPPAPHCPGAARLRASAGGQVETDHGAAPAGARLKDTSVHALALCPRPHGLLVCCLQTLPVRKDGLDSGVETGALSSVALCAVRFQSHSWNRVI